ncbi:MAG: hypothetical protein WDA27_01095 [Actinomycetota bacterium]
MSSKSVGARLREAEERLREARFAAELPDNPDFVRMMDLAEDPEAGIDADELVRKYPHLA